MPLRNVLRCDSDCHYQSELRNPSSIGGSLCVLSNFTGEKDDFVTRGVESQLKLKMTPGCHGTWADRELGTTERR